jgi:hypothetical protein
MERNSDAYRGRYDAADVHIVRHTETHRQQLEIRRSASGEPSMKPSSTLSICLRRYGIHSCARRYPTHSSDAQELGWDTTPGVVCVSFNAFRQSRRSKRCKLLLVAAWNPMTEAMESLTAVEDGLWRNEGGVGW